ncbi:hypothetical protein CIFAM_22_00430 [Citrobacter farmeri GTC 1319]|uniref:hypothetical protein n=1 Tax=Citrobacter farmeri TaxID=67824 RepID=UPI00050E61E1|nr:hypothetical protein [Citrobacter farmeri]QXA99830.1 hypothetical protein I6L53_23205 [Citrobacter farmeri]GAL51774.1 hypothetical protein CIFAM_22_00430 [Citrobacter farmeri GTC 1319]
MFDFSGQIQDIFSFCANEPLVSFIIIGSMYVAGLMMIGIMFTRTEKSASTPDSKKT